MQQLELDSRPLRILIGCETSGIARRAFAELGHEVWSCDILPAEDGSNRHVVCDIQDGIPNEGWDLLAVLPPPCTRLCRSERRWMSGPGVWTPPKQLPSGRTWESMKEEFEEGISIFTACWNAPIETVAVENPEMNDLTRARMPADLPAPSIVQPFWFGHPEYKATGWYLRNLPELEATDTLAEPERGSDEWRAWNKVHRMPPGPERARLRSRSFPKMMTAAAQQWAGYALQDILEEGRMSTKYAGYAHPIPGRRWWALSVSPLRSQLNSGPGFFGRKASLVNGPACLPSVAPSVAPLVAFMSQPIDGLFRRRERNPDTAILDDHGFLPTVCKHVQHPSQDSLMLSNTQNAVIVPNPLFQVGEAV